MKNEILSLVEILAVTSRVMPGNLTNTSNVLRSAFTEVHSGLYWKETPNGILSFNSDSVMFQKKDGTNEVIFDIGLDTPVMSFITNADIIALWVYVKITKEERLLADKVLMHWFNKNKHNI